MTTSAFAAGAYANVQTLAKGLAKPVAAIAPGAAAGGGDFAKMVTDAIGKTQQAGANADTQAALVAGGRADIVDVVTAVAESEAAIETLVAVRDRVIAAYEEIMRMPI
mgnify:CR=1 FL=1